jgi:Flp pilus assembly protein TadD
MKQVLFVCALTIAAASPSVAQPALGQATAERSRKEALQHYRIGQDAMRNERFDIAEKEFQKSAALDPTLELAPYGLGQVYMVTKRFRPAIVAFTRSREVFEANGVSNAGDQIAYQRRLDDYIRELEDQQAVYNQPGRTASNPTAQNYLRTLATQIAAMKSAKMRTVSGPEPVPAWLSLALGSAYFRTDAPADAEREYRAAIEVDPKLGEAHNNLAVVYMLTGRYTEADAEIKAAEKVGFKVNPQLKEDVKKALAQR